MKVENVNIKTLAAGDTIRHLGHLRTVCQADLRNDAFFGLSVFGDSYNLGQKPVEKVTFPKFFQGNQIN